MFWSKKKKQTIASKGVVSPIPQGGVEHDFEKMYRQESEIHRRWQCIEDVAVALKRKYEKNPDMIRYIDTLRSIEKVFSQGRVKGWSTEQMRKELVRNQIGNFSQFKGLDEVLAHRLYEEFQTTSATVVTIHAVARDLLARYADSPECCSFIGYVRDVLVAFVESGERKETGEGFKDRLILLHMETVAATTKMNIDTLREIYNAFQEALKEKG